MNIADSLKQVTPEAANGWINRYLNLNINNYELLLKNGVSENWADKKALQVFHRAAERVPAYKDFLKKNKIDHKKIKKISDFSQVPITDKNNYINAYPLYERTWGGKLNNSKIFASSSGTTGIPNYWPRDTYQEYEAAITHELLFKNLFQIDKYRTLIIVGFPMGVYVSGLATTLPSWLVAQKYNATILTSSNIKAEVIKSLSSLAGEFEQILLIGHPFFIKDIIETEWPGWKNRKKILLAAMFCSEGFNEEWREYLHKKSGVKNFRAYNTYGSSEMLLMGYETPLSIKLRKLAENDAALARHFFGAYPVPNVFQYNPLLRYIQEINDSLIFTVQGNTPLIRFNLNDVGRIIPFKSIAQTFKPSQSEIQTFWKLPFLALRGRADYTVIFYAANIYPENIHSALNFRPLLKNITGKFTLTQGYKKNMDEYLHVNLELKTNIRATPKLQKLAQTRVLETLKQVNSEFKDANKRSPQKAVPQIKLWPYQHPLYFKPGLKPRYILTA